MPIGKNLCSLLCMVWGFSGIAMDDPTVQPAAANIPFENNIRLVFMGRTGAGKSTLINAFYNYTKKIKWNDLPKHFPIPTMFQSCNVVEYQGRATENHTLGQLASVTQEPSEYVSRGQNFVVSLIDCPGTADTGGMTQDIIKTTKIAEFMKRVGDFNAICIVLPVTTNRDTAETKYFIEQIKTIIPARAHNRIFTCVSYSSAENDDIRNFVQSVGLPIENILYFDSYPLTKDGYAADLTVDMDVADTQTDDPFGTTDDSTSSAEQQRKITAARKIKESWMHSTNEFHKLLRKAKALGRFTSADMARITEIKGRATEKILRAYLHIDSIEQSEAALRTAEGQLRFAIENYNIAILSKNSADIEYRNAQIEKHAADALTLFSTYQEREEYKTGKHNTICRVCAVVCHAECTLDDKGEYCTDHLPGCSCMSNKNCTVCPKNCPYHLHYHAKKAWTTVTKTRENSSVKTAQSNAASNQSTWQQITTTRSQDVSAKGQEKDTKNVHLNTIQNHLDCLRTEKDELQHQIVELYVELSTVSMSSINFHIGEYYDLCIRNEIDSAKRAKLNRDRQFYTEQVELYRRRMASNNS